MSDHNGLTGPVQDILDAIANIDAIDDVAHVMIETARSQGTWCQSYHLTPAFERHSSGVVEIYADGFPKGWLKLYGDPAFRAFDPLPDHVIAQGRTMTWLEAKDEVLAKGNVPPQTVEYFEKSLAAGLVHGVAIPLYGPNYRNAYASYGFVDEVSIDDKRVRTLIAVASATHRRIVDFLDQPVEHHIALSNREREVLFGISRGHSNNEIASLLGISPETVSTYVKRLFAKLETRDRIGATIKGLKFGLIHV